MDLLALLQAGRVDDFNDARARVNRVELFAEELAGLKLHAIDLSRANLDKSDLTETDMTEATLVKAFMSDIDGTSLILDGVLAMGVKMRDAWLEDADLTGGDFSRGDLGGAVLTRTKGEGVRMIGTRLKEAKADGATWELADLSEASLKAANFTGANLVRAKLTEAKCSHGIFNDADLSGVDAASVSFGGAEMTGAKLVGAKLVGASFAGANLTNADFTGAVLSRANFTNANLTGACFKGATLLDACLDETTLEGSTWADADLTGVDAHMLGLTEEQIEGLSAHGARFDPDADLVFDDAVASVAHGRVGVLWMNPDDPQTATLRWCLRPSTAKSEMKTGVLPVSGNGVLAHTIQPTKSGFALVAIVDRPGGACLLRWALETDGTVRAPKSTPLGYEPAVLPVFRTEGDALYMWCLARRGPMIVVHRDADDGEGFQVINTEGNTQASGFFGYGWPVLATKGGVVMQVGIQGVGEPRRMPDGFPNRMCTAVPVGDRILTVWNTIPRIRDPGGLRMKWLGGRRKEDTEELTRIPDVNAIDGVPYNDGALVAWTEDEGPEGGHVMYAHLPEHLPKEVPFPDTGVDGLRIVPPHNGEGPWLSVTTLDGALRVCTLNGGILAELGTV